MNIDIKFKVGDTIWFMYLNKPTKSTIQRINICVNLYTENSSNTVILVVPYNLPDVNIDKCFKTKKDLIKSL